jgi:hypothetical protein
MGAQTPEVPGEDLGSAWAVGSSSAAVSAWESHAD